MKKLAIYILLLLCASLAVAQQWQTVPGANVTLYGQNQSVPLTTLLTPTEPGIYRLVTYLSVTGANSIVPGFFHSAVYVQDAGNSAGYIYQFTETCAVGGSGSSPVSILSLKPGVPVTYEINGQSVPQGCNYIFAVTIEQFK